MVLFNICPETAEQQGPFKVKLCPALALKVFSSLSEWCFKSSRMGFANISSSSHCICLKALFFFLELSRFTFAPSSAVTATVSYFHCLLNDFSPRKSTNAVTLTLREGKVGALGTPGVFGEIIHTLIPLWFAPRLPLKACALAVRSSSLWIVVRCFSSPDTCHIVGKSCAVGTLGCRNSLLALLKIIWKQPNCAGFSLR